MMATMVTRLRDKIVKYSEFSSDTLYIKGISRKLEYEEVLSFLSVVESPIDVDLSMRFSTGEIWAKYSSAEISCKSIAQLHQKLLNSCSICARYELGTDKLGKIIVDRNSHNTVIRHIRHPKGFNSVAATGTFNIPIGKCTYNRYDINVV